LLRHCLGLVAEQGWCVGNVDTVVICERPKLAAHSTRMRELIAADLEIDIGQVSVKATTSERLGFTGREEGIAAQAVLLLHRRPD
jgi:2-C-methyl-D-erythritol 2,4-cyclodiphosphate synthase